MSEKDLYTLMQQIFAQDIKKQYFFRIPDKKYFRQDTSGIS